MLARLVRPPPLLPPPCSAFSVRPPFCGVCALFQSFRSHNFALSLERIGWVWARCSLWWCSGQIFKIAAWYANNNDILSILTIRMHSLIAKCAACGINNNTIGHCSADQQKAASRSNGLCIVFELWGIGGLAHTKNGKLHRVSSDRQSKGNLPFFLRPITSLHGQKCIPAQRAHNKWPASHIEYFIVFC